MYLLV